MASPDQFDPTEADWIVDALLADAGPVEPVTGYPQPGRMKLVTMHIAGRPDLDLPEPEAEVS